MSQSEEENKDMTVQLKSINSIVRVSNHLTSSQRAIGVFLLLDVELWMGRGLFQILSHLSLKSEIIVDTLKTVL